MKNTIITTMIWLLLGFNILCAQQSVLPNQINRFIPTSQTIEDQPAKNYIRTYTYRNSNPTEGNPQHVNVDIQYYDGLGRPVETVAVKASPTGKDMVTLQSYDSYGRANKSYLPLSYTISSSIENKGAFVDSSTVKSKLQRFLNLNYELISTDSLYGFSKPQYEPSPLNRIVQQGAPGAEWQTSVHPVQHAYQTNTVQDTSYKFSGNTYSMVFYSPGTLYVTLTTDEDSKYYRTYTDKQGKVVMKEVCNNLSWWQTKYCYDDFGLLRCVIQPHVTTPDSTEGCFFYRYDARQRMIAKKVPGSGWSYMIYDPRDRLVLTSDSVSRLDGTNYDRYYYTVYDDLNRPVEKGYVNTSYSRDYLRNYYSTNTVMFTSTNVYYTEKLYYDSHGPVRAACPFSAITNWVTASDTATSCKGLLTGRITKTYYPTNSYFTTNEKTEAYYYDKYGRVRQTVSKNFTGGTEVVTNVYTFSNQIVQTRHSHTVSTNTYNLDMYYSYDHRGRLLNTEYEVTKYNCPGVARTIVSANVYNEAGLLKTKYLHSVKSTGLAFMQKVDYAYNVRGWLTGINDPGLSTAATDGDKFGMKLGYNRKPDGTSGTDICYNGNISGIKWGTPNYSNLQYLFTYNDVGWLKTATFSKTGFTSGSFNTTYTYYKNGNFNYITRKANNAVVVDQIRYGYNGPGMSRLKYSNDSKGDVVNVDDFSGTLTGDTARYLYDGNGNLTSDVYKGLSIINDYQNHPKEIDIAGNNWIKYFYNSTGEKMMRSVMINSGTPTQTSYFGPFVSEGLQGGTNSLKYIMTPEGRIINNGTDGFPVWSWEYNLADHLGNVRVVLGDSTAVGYARVLQQTHYYPFGMRMSQISTPLTSTGNDYLYNGKQYQDDLNLNWYDYGARFYDPALGRFHSVDPMAEMYYQISPFSYCLNKPLLYTDPTGMWVATVGGYSTNDPDEIARFMSYAQTEQTALNNNPDINQMTGFVEGEMNGGGRLSNGANLVSEITMNQVNGGWEADQESFHQAWVDVHKVLSGDKYHFGPVEGEPVMQPLNSWYAKAWSGISGGREYAGRYVTSQGLLTDQFVPRMDNGPMLVGGPAGKILGNLKSLSNLTLREGIMLRGGKAGNLRVVGEWLHGMKIGEVANLAAKGDKEAMTGIKILKQAASKAQKY